MKSLFRRPFRRGEVLEVFDSELENELGSELAKAEDAGEFVLERTGQVEVEVRGREPEVLTAPRQESGQ